MSLLSKFSRRTSNPASSAFRSDISLCKVSCSLEVEDWICLFVIRILFWNSSTLKFFSVIRFFSFSICSLCSDIVFSVFSISVSLRFFVLDRRVFLHRFIVVSNF